MNFDILLPITVLICIAYAIRVVVDAMARRHLANAAASAEVIESILRHEERRRRLSILRWGIVLLALGAGFTIIQWVGWKEITPGFIAVLVGATGAGNLVFFALSRNRAAPGAPVP